MGLFCLRSIRNNFQPYFFSITVHRHRSVTEWLEVSCAECLCPACRQYKLNGLKISGMEGFGNRATHNLWILLEEARLIRPLAKIAGTGKMPISQKVFSLVGWAGEPVRKFA